MDPKKMDDVLWEETMDVLIYGNPRGTSPGRGYPPVFEHEECLVCSRGHNKPHLSRASAAQIRQLQHWCLPDSARSDTIEMRATRAVGRILTALVEMGQLPPPVLETRWFKRLGVYKAQSYVVNVW